MGDEVDISIIKSTQSSLGKYVKRPPLSEKLLKKPPFRFIHDIITTIIKTTGFLNGLFEENELISDNVKDRESKILFLNKIIYVVGSTTGKTLTVKPSKVIAGQEPEKTNELLQCLALALDNKLNSDEAVAKYKQTLKKQVSSETKEKDVTKVSKENINLKLITKNATKTDSNTVVKPKQREVKKKESPPKKASQSTRSTSKKPAESRKDNDPNKKRISGNYQDQLNINNEKIVKKADIKSEVTQDSESHFDEKTLLDNTVIEADNNILVSKKNDSNLHPPPDPDENATNEENHDPLKEHSLKSIENDGEIHTLGSNFTNVNEKSEIANHDIYEENRQENYLSNTNNEISSTRSAEPRQISLETTINETKTPDDINTKIIRPISVRPSSSRPGAPRLREKHEESISDSDSLLIGKVNIIAENTVPEEDEESSIIIIENDIPKSNNEGELAQLDGNEHGHLVQQILNSQKEFSQVSAKTEIEWQFGAKKARDVINQEIDQLRFNLQALSRVANPLGKLLDHIQEDVEVMRQESQHWMKTYEDAHKELRKQKKLNDEKLKPLHSKIRQLDAEITDKQDKINDLKITIHKNAIRIDKLLANGNKQ